MALTGPANGLALGPPAGLVAGLRSIAEQLAEHTRRIGTAVQLDPLALLGERAALTGLRRAGRVSCGGATRLLPTADGWVAVSLARPDDWGSVAAWIGAGPTWDDVATEVAGRAAAEVVMQGVLLGLPVAVVPSLDQPPATSPAVVATPLGDAAGPGQLAGALVVDLTSLWAGPLCGSLLADAGATVVKVESSGRPDGGRAGPPAFFDLLNAGKRSVALDLATSTGRAQLAALIAAADVVLEGSRPRALEQLGIERGVVMAQAGPQVWVSITGHGRGPDARERVGFGDDAAAAGGLVVWSGDGDGDGVDDGDGDGVDDQYGPYFCADAVADPAVGLAAATAVADAIEAGGRWTLDVALASVAASLAGPTLSVPAGTEPAEPRARPSRGPARALGADTGAVLAELARRS